MNIRLRVTPEALRTKAAEVEDEVQNLEQAFQILQDTVARTNGYWIGMAGEAARTAFVEQQEAIQEILARFSEHPGKLLSMAGVYDEHGRAAAAQNQALETDIIL